MKKYVLQFELDNKKLLDALLTKFHEAKADDIHLQEVDKHDYVSIISRPEPDLADGDYCPKCGTKGLWNCMGIMSCKKCDFKSSNNYDF